MKLPIDRSAVSFNGSLPAELVVEDLGERSSRGRE